MTQEKTILVACGPAGCGKSTVGKRLADELSVPFIEGDDVRLPFPETLLLVTDTVDTYEQYHSKSNKAKMASGIPLTDSDRWTWLISLREAALDQLAMANTVVVACSSLRRRYRDVFRVAPYTHPNVRVRFLYLRVDQDHLQARTRSRPNHYMKDNMVSSQLEILEEPGSDEADAVTIDGRRDPSVVFQDVMRYVHKELGIN